MMMGSFQRTNNLHMMPGFYTPQPDAQFYGNMGMHYNMGYNNTNQGFIIDNNVSKIKKFNSANKTTKSQY